jgi:hypothetical protein
MAQAIVKRYLKKARECISVKKYEEGKDACMSALDYDSDNYTAYGSL